MPSRRKIRILCIAEAFGFGPASKLIAFLHRLPLQSCQLTYIGNGCAYELCRNGNFHRTIQADPTDLGENSIMRQEIPNHDVLLTAMEFIPVELAKKSGLKIIVLDSLFWMWPKLPCKLELVDLYLCQNFLGVRDIASKYEVGNLVVIPPLTLSETPSRKKGNKVLLNFGGMDNPFAKQDQLINYASCMLSAVQNACRTTGTSILVHGRESVLNDLDGHLFPGIEICGSIHPANFVELMKQARCIITSPGLEVLYEAFTLGIPVFVLPPQNNSQSYQVQLLKQEIPLLAGLQYHDLINSEILPMHLSPEIAIGQVLEHANEMKNDNQAMSRLCTSLQDFLSAGQEQYDALISQQFGFLKQMQISADVQDFSRITSRLEQILLQDT